MKKMSLAALAVAFITLPLPAIAVDNSASSAIQAQYENFVQQGKSYKDAFEALQYEIAYETASVQSKSPCKKMVRGL